MSTETKSSYMTTEFLAYIAAVIGVCIAFAIVDGSDFDTRRRGSTSPC